MPPRQRDPEDNDRRRPRAFRHPGGSDGEDLVDDDDDIDDDDDGDGDSDDEELEIPDDPAHEARMVALREENAQLESIVLEQNEVIDQMALRTTQIQEATAQRREELNQLRAAHEQQERDAQEAASANENKPHQKDEKDPDPGGDLSTSTSQPSN